LGDSESLRSPLLRFDRLSDRVYLCFGQLGQTMRFAFGRSSPIFGVSIGHIVSICSQKQMRRVAAGWVVASMANQQIGRDGAMGDLPGDPMRIVCLVSETKPSIAGFVPAGRPLPALLRPASLHLSPKPYH
jgi:hypothetical protein